MRAHLALVLLLPALGSSAGCFRGALPAGPPSAASASPGRLPEAIAPTAYRLHWRIDPARPEFSGRVAIDLQIAEPSDGIWFHAVGLTIDSARIQIGDEAHTARILSPAGDAGTQLHRASLRRSLPVGPATLILEFHGKFDRHLTGLYRARDGERWYAYTQFEPADARKAFPCLDEPGFKVPFDVSVSIPAGLKAFSNAPTARTQVAGDWKTITFAATPPLPTYLVALLVGDLDVVSTHAGTLPLRGLAARGKGARLKHALEAHAELLPLLEAYFGRSYPFAKLDVAALLEFAAGAMENAGLITYREELLLTDASTASLGREERIGSVAAHELSHQWFGNLVTMAWWNDLWLNEAFATWMGAKIVDQWHPEFEQGLDLLEGRARAFSTDSLAAARAVRQPVASVSDAQGAFDGLTYVKGGAVLGMLEAWIGPEVFRRGVTDYLDRHAWGSATADDLFAALERASDQPVGEVAHSFLDRPGVPLIDARLRCEDDGAVEIDLRQSRYHALGAAPLTDGQPADPIWSTPICLAWPVEGRLARQCLLLTSREATIRLAAAECPPWVHPNAGEWGYYRWSLPAKQLPEIAAWLEGQDDPDARRMRVALLDQAFGGMQAGKIEPAGVLSLLEKLSRSRDPRVQRLVAGRIEQIASFWPALASHPSFEAFVQRTLGPLGQRLGWKAKANEPRSHTLMRGKILWTLGRRAHSAWVLEGARTQARRYLDDPEAISGDIAPTALKLAARQQAIKQEELLSHLKKSSSPQRRLSLMAGLGAASQGANLAGALALMLDKRIRVQDAWTLFWGGLDGKSRTRQTFAFLQERYDDLQKRLPSFGNRSAGRLARLVGLFCNETDRDAARTFFTERAAPNFERYLAMGLETANRCMALRRWGRASARAFLEGEMRPPPQE